MQSKAAIAREYVLRHEDDLREGRLNKAQLAKQLVKDHPGLWDSVEHARYSVRSVTCAGTSNTTVAFEMPSTIAHGLQAVNSVALDCLEPVGDGGWHLKRYRRVARA
jgi:hypothetical protein